MHEIIVQDTSKVNTTIRWNERDQSACKIILDHLDRNLPYHDSLMVHFRQAHNWSKLMLSKGAFDNAKSYGMHCINDDTTRQLLTRLYEYRIVWSETVDRRQTLYYYNTVVPELTDLFEFTSAPSLYRKGVRPNDYESLKGNPRFSNILKSNIENRHHENNWLRMILNDMRVLEERLQKEINGRQ